MPTAQRARKAAQERVLVKSKAEVRQRSAGACERCGAWCGTGGDVHHRMPRRMGGTAVEWVNLPANLVHLCRGCHDWAERNRTDALATGWLLPTGELPDQVPVTDVAGLVWVLTGATKMIMGVLA